MKSVKVSRKKTRRLTGRTTVDSCPSCNHYPHLHPCPKCKHKTCLPKKAPTPMPKVMLHPSGNIVLVGSSEIPHLERDCICDLCLKKYMVEYDAYCEMRDKMFNKSRILSLGKRNKINAIITKSIKVRK